VAVESTLLRAASGVPARIPCEPRCRETALQSTQLCTIAGVHSPATTTDAQQKRWVLSCAVLASTMAFVDESVVNVALPRMEADLQTSLSAMQWVINAYTLCMSALLLIGGAAGDRFGRRRIFMIGISVFALASVACGLAPNPGALIGARALQGVGAAFLIPCGLALISAVYDEKERGAAIGVWSGASAIAAGAGPILGGWIVDHSSWRAIFLINPILAIPALWIALRYLSESRAAEVHSSLDWPGALTVFLGLGGIVYGLIAAAALGWSDASVIGAIIGGSVFLLIFLRIEQSSAAPMVPLGLFKSRQFTGVNLLTLLLYGALSGTFFFLPFLIIQVYGYSAAAAGAIFIPFALILGGLSKWSGSLMDRFGARWPLIIGPTIAAVGLLLLALLSEDGRYFAFILPIVVLAFGMAITIAPLTTTVLNAVKEEQTGVASGINNAAASVAGLLVIAIMGTVALRVLDLEIDAHLRIAQPSVAVRRAVDAARGGFIMPHASKQLSAAERVSLQQISRASFAGTIYLVLLVMAALAFASASIAVLMIQ
jgi:EmrB/QacA subfamily drug resistance transporter